MAKANEWDAIKRQLDELMRGETLGAENIDEVLDTEFRRRFAELIYQTARRNSTGYNWPRLRP